MDGNRSGLACDRQSAVSQGPDIFIGSRVNALGRFAATPEGAEAAGAAAALYAAELSVERAARRAHTAMAVLVSWLVGNGNCGGWIAAGMRFDVKTRELELRAGDAGTLLPTTFEGERLSSMLAAAEDVDSGAWPLQVGRVVWARLHVPRFTVRYTWRVPAGMVHPVHSFEQCDNEELAERAAQWAVRNRLGACGLLVTEVSVREGSTAWQLVAASQDAATDVDEPVELDRHSTETTSRPTVGRVVRPSVRTGRH